MKYKIILQADKYQLVAHGPAVFSTKEDGDYEESIYSLNNLTVEDNKGNVCAPVFEELEVFTSSHHKSFGDHETTAGYHILYNEIYLDYNGINMLRSFSDKPISKETFNALRNTYFARREGCEFENLVRGKVSISSFAGKIIEFQSNRDTSIFNATSVVWDGSILRIIP